MNSSGSQTAEVFKRLLTSNAEPPPSTSGRSSAQSISSLARRSSSGFVSISDLLPASLVLEDDTAVEVGADSVLAEATTSSPTPNSSRDAQIRGSGKYIQKVSGVVIGVLYSSNQNRVFSRIADRQRRTKKENKD
ncbi:hypothetical protein O181_052001 [Austropuccinia psidii MF-1]|uniref:Uncharacterized protein n=1 Tax=Austropuccinia psidii MF-1 TaxID=1389203 RepID=A0A9Q3E4S5_9BASI|nr:hypothetical protein [Austropuccinia psidii MF-1]